MTRNLKVLGLALVAVFAMSAVIASAASAQNGIFTTNGWTALTGKNTGEVKANSLTLGSFSTTCEGADYTVGKIDSTTTPKTGIPNGATSATVVPHYGVCSTSGFPTTVDMNGCDYVFDLKATNPSLGTDVYNITSTIVCPAGQHILVTIYTVGAHETSRIFCEIEVTGTDYDGLHGKDTTNNTLDVTGTIENIAVDVRRGTVANGHDPSILPCPEATKVATLHIDVSAPATAGTITVSHL